MTNKGRPTIYQTKYCQKIIDWMADGYSISSFAGKIGVGERTIYDWVKKYEEFSQSIKIGRTKSILYWEQIGMKGMNGEIPHFNATVWIFNMKNRLGWADKLTVDLGLEENDNELENEIEEELPTYDNLVSGTAKLQPIFQLKRDENLSKYDLVQRAGVEPALDSFTDCCLTVRLPLVEDVFDYSKNN